MEAEEIFEREHGPKKPVKEEHKSPIVDGRILAVDEKLTKIQVFATKWQRQLVKNETLLSFVCFFLGVIYSYAINKCTGDFNVAWYTYVLAIGWGISFSLLLIREGSLPLSIIAKFILIFLVGHVSLMFFVAADSQTFHLFTVNVCRIPFGWNELTWWTLGLLSGYLIINLYRIKR
jgi:hypothetical protein